MRDCQHDLLEDEGREILILIKQSVQTVVTQILLQYKEKMELFNETRNSGDSDAWLLERGTSFDYESLREGWKEIESIVKNNKEVVHDIDSMPIFKKKEEEIQKD